MPKTRPNGYWQKWENAESSLQELMCKYDGLIPTFSGFERAGLAGLYISLQKYHGGIAAVRKRLKVFDKKKCSKCNTVKLRSDFRIRKDRLRAGRYRSINNICKKCSAKEVSEYRRTWKGRAAEALKSSKHRARQKGWDFDLDRDFLLGLLASTGFCCALTGRPFQRDGRHSASLDRIDSSRGYTKKNVRFIGTWLNRALSDASDDEFEQLASSFLRGKGRITLPLSERETPPKPVIENWPMGSYASILADPSWAYQNWESKANGASKAQYPCMSVDDIAALPVQDLAAADCVLFLWVTFPKLVEGLHVLDSWGFEYKTVAFDWTKTYRDPFVVSVHEFVSEVRPLFGSMKKALVIPSNGKEYCGLGFYTRQGNEICLLGTRGSPKRQSANVRGQVIARRRKHSEKPLEVYDRIEELMDGPYLELFATQQRANWTSWGNAVNVHIPEKGAGAG